jgi:hypothetical protein
MSVFSGTRRCCSTDVSLTTHHLPKKGDDMAVVKNTRKSVSDTNQIISGFFRKSQVSEERERTWRQAMRLAESGTLPLRFPVYENLYQLNVSPQKLVDLLQDIAGKFGIDSEQMLYHRLLVQGVRSTVTCHVMEYMSQVEHIDLWQFGGRRKIQEKKFEDPDEVYFKVQNREKERAKEGLAPLIRFLGKDPPATKRPKKSKGGRTQMNVAQFL